MNVATVRTDPNALVYPIAGRPEQGEVMEVAEGVFWVRMAIPIKGLDYINLWLLDDGDGWTLVDTGLRTPSIRETWERIIESHLGGRPIRRVICTHFHPDHMGQAGWFVRRFDAPLCMTLGEWLFGRCLLLEQEAHPPAAAVTFYRRGGFSEEELEVYSKRPYDRFKEAVCHLPTGFSRIEDGQSLRIGGRTWRVMVGRGHSPEHACLYCAELGLLISGDQILPRITPHIGVYPMEPEADPLRFYLNSLGLFRGLPADTLVLPAHGDPFRNLSARLDQIGAHHHDRLRALLEALAEPKTVVEVLPVLFRRDHSGEHKFLAHGEALAHLHWLLGEGLIERSTSADGVHRFLADGADAPAALRI
ncbi:MBL fold metallo-hydrolase [Marinibaculum pumilum]|uniref:MBL fold metallo-hydrolase n=1 Tax=Marinibaculum pumilum TaxID=1766165 RepID=A0ABV7LB54_9PROT